MMRGIFAGLLLFAVGCHAPAPSLSMMQNPPIIPPPGTGTYGTANAGSYYQRGGTQSAAVPSANQGAWSPAQTAGGSQASASGNWPVAQASYQQSAESWAPVDGRLNSSGSLSATGPGGTLPLNGMPVNDATLGEPRMLTIPPDAQPIYNAAGQAAYAPQGYAPQQFIQPQQYVPQPQYVAGAAPQYGLSPGQYLPNPTPAYAPSAGGSSTMSASQQGWKSRYDVGNGN